MRTNCWKLVVALGCAAALTGCFVEVESDGVVVEHDLPVCDAGEAGCAFPGISAAEQELFREFAPIIANSGVADFTVELGEDFEPERDAGPVTLDGKLVVKRVTLTLTTPGASFAGIESLQLVRVPPAFCFEGNCDQVVIAEYVRPAEGGDPSTIVLTSTGVNLLDLTQDGNITVRLLAKGILPEQDWTATLRVEGDLASKASFP